MKKTLSFLTAVLLVFVLAFAGCAKTDDNSSGGGNSAKPGTATLTEIYVATAPEQTEYTVGDNFSKKGMVVKARYSDGKEETVTAYSIDKTDPLTLEDKVVTITYKGKTATVNITVKEPEKKDPTLTLDPVYVVEKGQTSGSFKFEAEDEIDPFEWGCINSAGGSTFLESHDNASGGASLACLSYPGNTIGFIIENQNEENVKFSLTVTLSGAGFTKDKSFDNAVKTKLNGAEIPTGGTIKANTEELWTNNWCDTVISDIELIPGRNSVTFSIYDAVNIDCFKIIINPDAEEIDRDAYDEVIDNKGEYVIEMENLMPELRVDLGQFDWVSGGAGVEGTVGKTLEAKVYVLSSTRLNIDVWTAYAGTLANPEAMSKFVTFKIDEQEVVPNAFYTGFTDAKNYRNYEAAPIAINKLVSKGEHTISVTFDASGVNGDCIKITNLGFSGATITKENADVAISEAGEYKVEAENISWSELIPALDSINDYHKTVDGRVIIDSFSVNSVLRFNVFTEKEMKLTLKVDAAWGAVTEENDYNLGGYLNITVDGERVGENFTLHCTPSGWFTFDLATIFEGKTFAEGNHEVVIAFTTITLNIDNFVIIAE